jgi:hypothetical protein
MRQANRIMTFYNLDLVVGDAMLPLAAAVANDGDDIEKECERLISQMDDIMRRVVSLKLGSGASFAAREAATLELSNDVSRRSLQWDLQRIADSHADSILVNGQSYRRHHAGTVDYHSLCGPLTVTRATYRRTDERNGPTIVPIELSAGVVEGATPALAYRVALGYAQGPGRHAEEQMRADHRLPPSRSTLERMAKQIGSKAHAVASLVEPDLRAQEMLPDGASAISIGLDRTSAPMEELRPADAQSPSGRRKRTKPYVRKPPPRVDVNYRMAYVGTVSVVDKDGESLVTRRYAASADEGPQDILARMMGDVQRAKKQNLRLPVGVIQDGAPELWSLVRDALKAERSVRRWYEGVDRYHLNERLAEILRVTQRDTHMRTKKLKQWCQALDEDDGAIDKIAKWLSDQMAGTTSPSDLEILQKHWTFILNNNDRMRYATLRKAGLPCGSGATEGACKSLVMIRAKGCGQRWHCDGLSAALTLRAIYMSERLETFWNHFAKGYIANVDIEGEAVGFKAVA